MSSTSYAGAHLVPAREALRLGGARTDLDRDAAVFTAEQPSYQEVLEVRAGRVAMVREFLATVSSGDLATVRNNPWAPEHPETTLSCLHTILEEEWEHHRHTVRDLDAIENEQPAGPADGQGVL